MMITSHDSTQLMSQWLPSSSVLLSSSSHSISPHHWAIVGDWPGLGKKSVVKITRHKPKDILQQQFGKHAKFCPSSFNNVMYALWKNVFINRGTHLFMLHLVCDLLTDPEKHHHLFHGESTMGQFEDFCIMKLVSDVVK